MCSAFGESRNSWAHRFDMVIEVESMSTDTGDCLRMHQEQDSERHGNYSTSASAQGGTKHSGTARSASEIACWFGVLNDSPLSQPRADSITHSRLHASRGIEHTRCIAFWSPHLTHGPMALSLDQDIELFGHFPTTERSLVSKVRLNGVFE